MSERGAYTLIELALVMAASLVLLSMAALPTEALFRARATAEEHLTHQQSVVRLGESLRGDAHAATAAALAEEEPAGSRLVLSMPGGERVEYRFVPGRVLRRRLRDDRTIGRDAFHLAEDAGASFEIERDREPAVVRAVLERNRTGDDDRPTRMIHIDATVGRDHRFQMPEK